MARERVELRGRNVRDLNEALREDLRIEKAIDITPDWINTGEKALVLYARPTNGDDDRLRIYFLDSFGAEDESPANFVLPLGVRTLSKQGEGVLKAYAKRYGVEFGEVIRLTREHAPNSPTPLYRE